MKMHKSKTESQTLMLAICGTLCSTVDCFIFFRFPVAFVALVHSD